MMPTVFGALSESSTVSFSSTLALSAGRSRATGVVEARTSARSTRAAFKAAAIAPSCTSTTGGDSTRSSMP